MKRLIKTTTFAVLGGIMLAPFAHASDGVPAGMAGKWKGSGKIIVTWCEQKELPVEIEIFQDGRVTGRIGGAAVENGRVAANSGMLVRLGNPKYVISADLKGPIVKAEGIVRTAIKLFVNLDDGRLTGGFHTSGGKFGGKDAMMLSGSGLALIRGQKDGRQ